MSNLGGTWPKALVLQLVDYFTRTACIGATDGDGLGETCATEALRDSCKAAGGSCEVLRDGYYVVNWTGVVLGTAIFLAYVKPRVKRLEMLGPKQWRVPDKREQ